ncbi:MAG: hypothetical protein EPO20_01115 [Betaproteobacteria bacterium]|nr:MAG: hypothetical protein EPO20_01115 [Betaproteobacteria bacterium]
MGEGDVGRDRRPRLLRDWGFVALILMLVLSRAANVYCSIDREPLPANGTHDHAVSERHAAGSLESPPSDGDACHDSDALSMMQAPDIQHPGDIVALVAQVLAFRDHSPRPEPASSLGFFNDPPLRWEPVFQRVPRLLI